MGVDLWGNRRRLMLKSAVQRFGMLMAQFEQGYVALEGSKMNSMHKELVWKIPCYLTGGSKRQKQLMAACICNCTQFYHV